MFEIAQLFYNILLLKKAPQDVPFSRALTQMLLAVYALISFLMLFMSSHRLSAILQTGADILLLIAFLRVTLAWVHKSERYQQTLCALLGVDILLTLFSIAPTAVMLVPNSGGLAILGFYLLISLILWHWAVIAHILSHALEQTFSFCVGLALLYMLANYLLMGFLFT